MAATAPKMSPKGSPSGGRSVLNQLLGRIFDIRVLGVLGQILAVVLVILFFSWIGRNTAANIEKLGTAQFICRDGDSSFRCALDFLQSDAQFDISEGPLDYSPADSYWTALGQGALNTLKVVVTGIILTTILGTVVGIARLSQNWLISNIARWYVDLFRNTPLVLQLVFIFFTFFAFVFPTVREATKLAGLPIYLTNRGINYPTLVLMSTAGIWFAFVVLALIQAQVVMMFMARQEERTGKENNRIVWAIFSFFAVSILGYVVASNWTTTHGIMSHTRLRIREIDDIDTLVRGRFNVNFADQISGQIAAYEAIKPDIIAGDILVDGEVVTLDAINNGDISTAQLSSAVGFDVLTDYDIEQNGLKLCSVRDTNAAVNFTSQLDRMGIPYVMDVESRADKVTANYIEGECEIFVGNLSLLAAERDVVELARVAATGEAPTSSAHNIATFREPPVVVSVPRLQGLNFVGGGRITAFFSVMLIGLVLNTGANVAEIVRAGIQSVSKGQTEAARALGLSEGQRLSLVILPQALTVIIPPLISQYLNLAKNSTLGVAIGYMEFWTVSSTIINQSGRAIQPMLIVMAAFLALSISISTFLNWYNSQVVIKER